MCANENGNGGAKLVSFPSWGLTITSVSAVRTSIGPKRTEIQETASQFELAAWNTEV